MPDDENLEINPLSNDDEEEEETDVAATVITNPDFTGPLIEQTPGSQIERKALLTVVEWDNTAMGGTASAREVIGARVEDSAIELNPDIQTVTDILGLTYTDINKTEPQQDVDIPVLAGSELCAYLTKAMLANDIDKYNQKFTAYIITAFISETSSTFYAVKHTGCSLIPKNIGGSTKVVESAELHFSNNLTEGTVATNASGKLDANFTFTAAS